MAAQGGIDASFDRGRLAVPGRPSVFTCFQFAGSLSADDGKPPEHLHDSARQIVLDWIQQKFPQTLPPEAAAGKSFHVDVLGQEVEVVAVDGHRVWSLYLEHPDAEHGDIPAVAGRTWSTDAVVGLHGGRVRFGLRTRCSTLPFVHERMRYTTPLVFRAMVAQHRVEGIAPHDGSPWRIESEEDLDALLYWITDERRGLPVVVLTEPDENRLRLELRPYLLDEVAMADDLLGVATVATLPYDPALAWTERVGERWSVYRGAVRVYRPGLDFHADDPYEHPRYFPEQILATSFQNLVGEDAFQIRFEQSLRSKASIQGAFDWSGLPFVERARDLSREERELASADTATQLERAHSRISELERQLGSARRKEDEAIDSALAHIEETERLEAEVRRQSDRIWTLTQIVREAGLSAQLEANPTSYDGIPQWVDDNMAGRLILHPRAIRALQDARFDDADLVCEALKLLAHSYHDMKVAVPGALADWKQGLDRLGLRLGRSIERGRQGEEGDAYVVEYPLHSGRKRDLELALKKGTSRHQERCLRIYFFWDDEETQVVVGWLPSHLPTRIT